MPGKYKTSYKVYSAWNYQKEVEDLNKASEQGWQLIKGGCFHSRFVRNPDVRYRYQLDYQKIDDMPRYIETFREQGWEYINSTFNGWHYLRKLYDPSLPEEAYEIFTDRESLQEMNGRWARLAMFGGIVLGLFALIYAIRMFRQPDLPSLVQLLTFAIESAVLFRGMFIMRNPESSRNRKGDGAFLTVFFAVILLGAGGSIALGTLRPGFSTDQRADSVDTPITDNRWIDFKVHYPDNYYLDLDMEAPEAMTFEIIDENGEVVYSVTETSFQEEDIRLKLARGEYSLSLSYKTGFHAACSME